MQTFGIIGQRNIGKVSSVLEKLMSSPPANAVTSRMNHLEESVMRMSAGEWFGNTSNRITDQLQLQWREAKAWLKEEDARTKCWKVVLPYKFKDIMEKDDVYPTGWSSLVVRIPRKKELELTVRTAWSNKC